MKHYRLLYLAAALSSALPAIADVRPHLDVWVRHESDFDRKGRKVWQGNNLYDNNTDHQPQERTVNVSLQSPTALAVQTFYFSVQNDYFQNTWSWLRMCNTHGFSKGAESTFVYKPTLWDMHIYVQRSDGIFVDQTDMIINWRKWGPNGDGYPLGVIGTQKGGQASRLFKVTIRPKVTPKRGSGLCISLWTPVMFSYSDCATATVVYK